MFIFSLSGNVAEDKIILGTVIEGGALGGKEGGLRVDMFEHDDPDDLQCLCDLPYAAQEIIHDEIEIVKQIQKNFLQIWKKYKNQSSQYILKKRISGLIKQLKNT
mgnify:CR=1 FL=1